MRTILAIAAAVVLVYCGSNLLGMPAGDTSLLDTLVKGVLEGNRNITINVGGFVLSAFVLFLLALRRTRIIVEERKLDHVRQFIKDTTPWLAKREARSAEAASLLAEVSALDTRLAALQAPTTGLPSRLNQLIENSRFAAGRLEELSVDDDRDIVDEIDAVERSVADTSARLERFESRVVLVPGLVESATDLMRRVAALQDGNEQVRENVGKALEVVNDLTKDDGTLSELQAGHGDWEGTLPEQIKGLVDDIQSATESVSVLEKSAAEMPSLLPQVATLEERVAALAHEETGIIAQLTSLNEKLQALINNDDGKLKELEAGDPNDPNNNDNVEDQISSIKDDIGSIGERIEALVKQYGEVGELRRSLAAFAEAAPASAEIIPGPGADTKKSA